MMLESCLTHGRVRTYLIPCGCICRICYMARVLEKGLVKFHNKIASEESEASESNTSEENAQSFL